MGKRNSINHTIELRHGLGRCLRRSDDAWESKTREIFRPAARDRTIELCEADLEELVPSMQPVFGEDDDRWSIDIVVEEGPSTSPRGEREPTPTGLGPIEPSPAGLGPEPMAGRGMIWRFLFRLGWVSFEDDSQSFGL